MSFHEGIHEIEVALSNLLEDYDNPTSPAEDISFLLSVLKADSFEIGRNLFVGREPESPNDCITIYDTGGPEQEAGQAINEVNVQIRSRSSSYQTAFREVEKIKLALQSIPPLTINDKRIVGIWILNPPSAIGRDKQDRTLFTMNLKMITEPNEKANRL